MTRPAHPPTPPTASRLTSWRRLTYDEARLLGIALCCFFAVIAYPYVGRLAFVAGVVVGVLPAAFVREDG